MSGPDCTRHTDDGRITAPGHSRRGELATRRILWELGVPIGWREHVAALVRHHQVPFWALERPDLQRIVLRVSLLARNDDLAMLATADILRRAVTPSYAAYDDTRTTVTVLSGLPGVGKDSWIGRHAPDAPVVSLDALRGRLGVAPGGDQRAVSTAAYEQARVHLRAGRSFVWNATNVTRQQRDLCVGLAANYGSRVDIVSLEARPEQVAARNRSRLSPVPDAVIDRLAGRWETPDLTEAHSVRWLDTST